MSTFVLFFLASVVASQYGETQRTIDCPEDNDCTIICNEAYCRNSQINCPVNNECNITCDTRSCHKTIINATKSSLFNLYLHPEPQSNLTVYVPPSASTNNPLTYIHQSPPFSKTNTFKEDPSDATRLTFYAVHGFNDLTSNTQHSTHGIMYCQSDFSSFCNFSATSWTCIEDNHLCSKRASTRAHSHKRHLLQSERVIDGTFADNAVASIAPPIPGWSVEPWTGIIRTAFSSNVIGPYSGTGGSVVDYIVNITQQFYCSVPADVSLRYRLLWCGDTEADDYHKLYLNNILQPSATVWGTDTFDGTLGSTEDNNLATESGCNTAWKYKWIDYATNNLAGSYANPIFTVKFALGLSADNEWGAISNVNILCTSIPTIEPTESPSNPPTLYPSIAPTASTAAPTKAPTKEYTSINDIWYDDHKMSSDPIVNGWILSSEVVTSGTGVTYYGPWNDPTVTAFTDYTVTRSFSCMYDSQLTLQFSEAHSQTGASDWIQVDYAAIASANYLADGSVAYSDSALTPFSSGWSSSDVVYSTSVNADELFVITFNIHITDSVDWIAIYDITIDCAMFPTVSPTKNPSVSPSSPPSKAPTKSVSPTKQPTLSPSSDPTLAPSKNPTSAPSSPSSEPSTAPISGTYTPSIDPTKAPTFEPTLEPTDIPSESPTFEPTVEPTKQPTSAPTTGAPSETPSVDPTLEPTQPTSQPTQTPTEAPSKAPSLQPTQNTEQPTASPVFECDETCKDNQSDDDDDAFVNIEATYSFADYIRYDLDNMQCFLYLMFQEWFQAFDVEFDVCHIKIESVSGGNQVSDDDTFCPFGPCLSSDTDPLRRLLSNPRDGNVSVHIITNDPVLSLSLDTVETQLETAFLDSFGVDLDVTVTMTLEEDEDDDNNDDDLSNVGDPNANYLWYIVGGLVLLLCIVVVAFGFYYRKTRRAKKDLFGDEDVAPAAASSNTVSMPATMQPVKSVTPNNADTIDGGPDGELEVAPLEGNKATTEPSLHEDSIEMMTQNEIWRYRGSERNLQMDGVKDDNVPNVPQTAPAQTFLAGALGHNNDGFVPPPPSNAARVQSHSFVGPSNSGNMPQNNNFAANVGSLPQNMQYGAQNPELYNANQSWPKYNAPMQPMQMYQPNYNPNMQYQYSSPQAANANAFAFSPNSFAQQQQQVQQQQQPQQQQPQQPQQQPQPQQQTFSFQNEDQPDEKDQDSSSSSSSSSSDSGTEDTDDSGAETDSSSDDGMNEAAPEPANVGRRISEMSPLQADK